MTATAGAIGKQTKFLSLFAALETNFLTSGFGGSPTDDQRVPVQNAKWTPDQDFIPREVQLDGLGNISGMVGGKNGKLTFDYPLHGLGTGNDHSASADATVGEPLASILLACCMKRVRQRGKATDASTQEGASDRTTDLVLASGAGAAGKFGVGNTGGAPFAAVARNSKLVVRLIPASASGDAQTLAPPLKQGSTSVTLTNGEDVYAADVFYPDQAIAADVAGTPYYISFIGSGAGYRYEFLGCRGRITKISGSAKKGCIISFEFQASTWNRTASSSTAGEKFTNIHSQIVALASPMYWKAAATGSTPIDGFEFDMGHALSTVETISESAPDGNAGFNPTAIKPTLKVKPFLDGQWITDFGNETQEQVLLQIGTAPGRCVVIALPYAQITKFPGETDVSGVVGHEVEFEGKTSTSGALAPCYIAFY